MSFAQVRQRLAGLDVESLLQVLNNPVIAQCIADCIGHFRILEYLKILWEKAGSKYDRYAKAKVATKAAKTTKSEAEAEAEADSLHPIPDSPEKFVPRVSPLQLLLFACANCDNQYHEVSP